MTGLGRSVSYDQRVTTENAPVPVTHSGSRLDVLDVSQVNLIADLLEAALPGEGFTADDVGTIIFDDLGVVLGVTDDAGVLCGVAAAVVRSFGDVGMGYVKVVAVHPSARRMGRGRDLLLALEAWCADEGATEVHLSGVAPVYFWPGIDMAAMTPMLCLAEHLGYQPRTGEYNMVLPVTFRAAVREGIVVRRIVDDVDDLAMVELITTHWPWWLDEYRRALEGATAIGAFEVDPDGRCLALGFVCHSVSRLGLLGPMGTHPSRQGNGVGAALVAEVGKDLMVAGCKEIEICWVGPSVFYAKLGAEVNRTFRTYRKRGIRASAGNPVAE